MLNERQWYEKGPNSMPGFLAQKEGQRRVLPKLPRTKPRPVEYHYPQQIATTVLPDFLVQVDQAAAQAGLSRSAFLRRALENEIAGRES